MPHSTSFKSARSKHLGFSVVMSDQSVWEQLVLVDAEAGSTASAQSSGPRAYDRVALEAFLSQDSWTKMDLALGGFIEQALQGALVPSSPSGSDSETGTEPFGSSSKRRRKRSRGAHQESDVYCAAWKSMMDTIATDKQIRKVILYVCMYVCMFVFDFASSLFCVVAFTFLMLFCLCSFTLAVHICLRNRDSQRFKTRGMQ
jgi:hypothetical protein